MLDTTDNIQLKSSPREGHYYVVAFNSQPLELNSARGSLVWSSKDSPAPTTLEWSENQRAAAAFNTNSILARGNLRQNLLIVEGCSDQQHGKEMLSVLLLVYICSCKN